MKSPSPLHEKTLAVLTALNEGAELSRNKNFALFEDPHARRARRVHRYLENLAADLKAHPEEVRLTRAEDERFAMRVEYPLVHGKRVAYLSALEVELLLKRHPWIRALLDGEGHKKRRHLQD